MATTRSGAAATERNWLFSSNRMETSAAKRGWSICGSVEMTDTSPRTNWILPLILPSSLARTSDISAMTEARARSSLMMPFCRSR